MTESVNLLPAANVGLVYARRLLLLAGASSLNYATRRQALLLFNSSATKLRRISNGAGGPELMYECRRYVLVCRYHSISKDTIVHCFS